MTEKDVLPAVCWVKGNPFFWRFFFFPEKIKKLVVVVVAVRKVPVFCLMICIRELLFLILCVMGFSRLLSNISCPRLDVLWFDGW